MRALLLEYVVFQLFLVQNEAASRIRTLSFHLSAALTFMLDILLFSHFHKVIKIIFAIISIAYKLGLLHQFCDHFVDIGASGLFRHTTLTRPYAYLVCRILVTCQADAFLAIIALLSRAHHITTTRLIRADQVVQTLCQVTLFIGLNAVQHLYLVELVIP